MKSRCRADLRTWLAANHVRRAGVWLVHHKKASPHYLPMIDFVEECLAWGWVDSFVRSVERLKVPDDHAVALYAAGPRTPWDGFAHSARRGILKRLLKAKRPETRGALIAEFVAKARDRRTTYR